MIDDDDFINNLTEEQKRVLIERLLGDQKYPKKRDAALVKQSEPVKTESKDDFTMHKSDNPKSKNRREEVKFRKNAWKDEGEFSEVETPLFEKTPRNRKKPNKTTVECHVCGKEFQINSNLLYGEYHRCNRCGGR